LSQSPIWDDIRTLEARCLPRSIDIIYGGFPCQDISIAGLGKGLAGERSGLFYEIVRLCSEIKPRFIFLENVPAITTRGGTEVVREIAAMGYDCRWCIISAASVGALHRRERWFLLAYAGSKGLEGFWERTGCTESKESESSGSSATVSNTRCKSTRSTEEPEWAYDQLTRRYRIWETEPDVGRVVDGIPKRVDRLRGLGNSVVPQQVKEAFKILMGIKKVKS
jgi:DNA (cytosine-5)-methyltransferase 1